MRSPWLSSSVVRLLFTLLFLNLWVLGACSSVPERDVSAMADPAGNPATVQPVAPPTTDAADPPTEPESAPVTVGLSPALPERYAKPLLVALSRMESVGVAGTVKPLQLLDRPDNADVQLDLHPLSLAGIPIASRFYAVVVPFVTVDDEVSWTDLQASWKGDSERAVYWDAEDARELALLLGQPGGNPVAGDALLQHLHSEPGALGLLAFDQLDPRYKVLAIDGVNVLSNQLDLTAYPLAVALVAQGSEGSEIAQALQGAIEPSTNRDPGRLTSLIMTGVTAMSRVTAARMEQKGYTYPAEIISSTLRAADITHVSNEVPFLEGCEVDASVDNLILCSSPAYWAALEAIGTDIVGLSGNHVNDFGREGARESISFYRDRGIPIYGSGLNVAEACAPLLWEHNGNRFAFLAALAFWPENAWATADQPGACYFYDNYDTLVASIQELRSRVDVISVELQYLETYEPFPTAEQVREFREVREAGVDIVTGVQSHVPQAMEPYGADDLHGPGIVVYGLGNLFFDQMWSWQTRTELIARHTIYQGRLIQTEILTAVLEDYAQPRWTTAEERAEILTRIFNAAPARAVSP